MSFPFPTFLSTPCEAPVAVFGGGVSGQAVLTLLGKLGLKGSLYDEKAGAGTAFEYFAKAGHRLVVFSPGFSVEHPWLKEAARLGCLCLGELDFASLFWKGRVIAITGTNGKTTLTEFLTHALRTQGCEVHATGNIGYSFSRLVAELDGAAPQTVAVCEVSSYQAEVLWHFRADSVLWTNFAEDHLERHPGLRAYFSAKLQLLQGVPAGASLVGSSVSRYATQLGFVLPSHACVPTEEQPGDTRLVGTVFESYPQRENFELARAWWEQQGRPVEALYAAASSFRLGRHRLAKVADVGGVEWWNDSKATNFHAVEAALLRFPKPVHLIVGGKAKGGDIPAFIARIASRVKHAYLIGETRQVLAEACEANRLSHSLHLTLEEVVALASKSASPGEQVLLSPAFASFDMFRGYDHRGEVFEALVAELGRRT